MTCEIPVSVVRGGTSRGVFLRVRDLPRDPRARDALCVGLIGGPNPLAVDGLGGGASSNSKVMAVGLPEDLGGLPWEGSCPAGVDLVTVFAQPAVGSAAVDWNGNCGNLSAAASAYALDAGLLEREGERASARVWNANTGAVFLLEHPLEGGRLPRTGEYLMSGAGGPGPRIDLRFLEPGGEKTGSVFPQGRTTELGDGVRASLVDVSNPLVILDAAAEAGVDPALSPAELNADAALLARLEALRREAGERMGVPGSAAVPRVACVAPGTEGAAVDVRVTSMGVFHHAVPVTVALALGSAAALGGTVLDAVLPAEPPGETTIRHPKGTVTVTAETREDGSLVTAGLARTARIVLTGTAFVPGAGEDA
ncbi:PrpF domain-containing protein [Rothia halotolerans]|uniref:PrpF domain-containing protein n=1 Tax=Rothia halotolerans TaxID=405770 RepID=UPI0013EDA0F6|nr:PrpF domain-containing protein [Rothia halotolerans]